MKKVKKISLAVFICLILFAGLPVADLKAKNETMTLEPPKISLPIPELPKWDTIKVKPGEEVSLPWLVEYIIALYKYAIIILSALAVIMIMAGGITYLSSGGSSERISSAKKMIFGALSGLVILLFSHMLLEIINPKLVDLKPITLETIEEQGAINESEFATNPAITNTRQGSGQIKYYCQFDKRWACYPLTGNECSHQVSKYACGTEGTTMKFENTSQSNLPIHGLTACRHADKSFNFLQSGQDYCQYLEDTYHVSDSCSNPNVENSAWCKNNPYGQNNFVEYCRNVSASRGKPVNLNNIQASGCGLTSVAMVSTYYGLQVTPVDTAKWFQENGFRAPGTKQGSSCCGINTPAFLAFAKAHNLTMKVFRKNDLAIKAPAVLELLNKELPLIFQVRNRDANKCKFTSSGHYIVVNSFDGNDTFGILDPSHPSQDRFHNNSKVATASQIWEDCRVMTISYIYEPGHYGEPASGTTTSSSSTGSAQSSNLDTSPYKNDGDSGKLNTNMSCQPSEIKSVAEAWGASNMITAPNSCARIAARILLNAGCNIQGAGGIGSFKTRLTNAGWKALIIGHGPAENYSNLIPVGGLFKCNNSGTLQHVYISTGKGGAVESNTPWTEECKTTSCPQQGSQTCDKYNPSQEIIDKCRSNGYIENLDAISGSPGGSCSINQCIRSYQGAKDAAVVMFPVLEDSENPVGCCTNDLINNSKNINGQEFSNGISLNKATCESIHGTWSEQGSCSNPLDPAWAADEETLKKTRVCPNGY